MHCLFLFLFISISLLSGRCEDWPTYRHDPFRSGITGESLDPSLLKPVWRYQSPAPPQTAWHGPAKWDSYAEIKGLKSMRNYDSAFYTTVIADRLFFASTVDDSVYCLSSVTGEIHWSFTTGGAVRIAPHVWDEKIYFGSDDGWIYCLDALDGHLIWKHNPVPSDRLIPSNGNLIPQWPCRSGVIVYDGIAYFTAALLPWEKSLLGALDAKTGRIAVGSFPIERSQATMEGALLVSNSRIYVPQGRRAPLIFNRLDGAYLGTVDGGGGVYAFITPDHHLIHGPGNKTGWMMDSHADSLDRFAKFEDVNAMLVTGAKAYILRNGKLFSMDRATKRIEWIVSCPEQASLILAGDSLVAGGDESVSVYSTIQGERIWNQTVTGTAYGLTAANGGLFISTSEGDIYAFRWDEERISVVE